MSVASFFQKHVRRHQGCQEETPVNSCKWITIKKGFQDSELEKWSVPRLLANYESTEEIDSAVKQLLWPIQKSDYDDYFKQYNHVDRKEETGHADGEADS